MADQIRTKTELLALFADNAAGNIGAQDLRDFVASNQAVQEQVETLSGATMNVLSDVFIADVGCADFELPIAGDYGRRFLSVINASGSLLTINGNAGEKIDGNSSVTLEDNQYLVIVSPDVGVTQWITLINTGIDSIGFVGLTDTPNDYSGEAGRTLKVTAGEDGLEFTDLIPGPQGDDGIQGDQGDQGDPGIQGDPGDDGSDGSDGADATPQSYGASHVEDSGSSITIIQANQWEDLNIAQTEKVSSSDMTHSIASFVYTGAAAKNFAVDFATSMRKSGGGSNDYEVSLAINGSQVSPAIGSTMNNSDWIPIVGNTILSLVQNDIVSLKVRSRSGTNNVSIRDVNLRLVSIS